MWQIITIFFINNKKKLNFLSKLLFYVENNHIFASEMTKKGSFIIKIVQLFSVNSLFASALLNLEHSVCSTGWPIHTGHKKITTHLLSMRKPSIVLSDHFLLILIRFPHINVVIKPCTAHICPAPLCTGEVK